MNKQAFLERLSTGLNNAFGGTHTGGILTDSLIVGSGAFLLTAVARAIQQSGSSITDYAGGHFDQDLDTTMKNPMLDKDTAKSLRRKQTTLTAQSTPKPEDKDTKRKKTASGPQWWENLKGLWNGAGELVTDPGKFFEDRFDRRDMLNYAVPATVAVLASIGGYKAIDNIYDKSDARKLNKNKERLTELHKKLVISRARNARGDLSNAEYNRLMKEIDPVVRSMSRGKTANTRASGSAFGEKTLAITGLLMLAAAGAGAIGGYNWSAAKNDKRLRYRAMKSGLKQMAQQQALMRSIDQKLTDDPEVEAYLSGLVKKDGVKAPTNTPINYVDVSI